MKSVIYASFSLLLAVSTLCATAYAETKAPRFAEKNTRVTLALAAKRPGDMSVIKNDSTKAETPVRILNEFGEAGRYNQQELFPRVIQVPLMTIFFFISGLLFLPFFSSYFAIRVINHAMGTFAPLISEVSKTKR